MVAPCIVDQGLWDGPWDQPWGQPADLGCLRLLMEFLPPGAAWPRDPCTWLGRVLWPGARAICDYQDLLTYFLENEFNPLTAVYMLPEWEAFLGLPEPCFAPITLKERQVAAFAKWTFQGVPSPKFFTKLGVSLGIPELEIDFVYMGGAFKLGHKLGHKMKGPSWDGVWKIKYKSGPWNTAFECLVKQYKLGHVKIFFETY